MYKILNGLSLGIMQDIFEIKSNYFSTCNAPAFSSRNIKTVRYGLQTTSYMASKIRDCIQGQNQHLEVKKLPLTTLKNLPFTDRLHYIIFLNTTDVVRLRARSSLSGNINAAAVI